MSREAYIIEAIRSPVGKKNGGLTHVHPVDLLAAHSLIELLRRVNIE
jgi:hypothetical protein